MGIRDRLGRVTGKVRGDDGDEPAQTTGRRDAHDDAMDVARYTYLLRVAGPERLVRLHAEAFAVLSEEQRLRIFARFRHDLPETEVPASEDPADLAPAAVTAERLDRGYLVRALRRPGYGVTEGHAFSGGGHSARDPLFSGSVLGPVTAAVAGSVAARESLEGFANSPEAAQVDATPFVRGPGAPTHASTLARHEGGVGE